MLFWTDIIISQFNNDIIVSPHYFFICFLLKHLTLLVQIYQHHCLQFWKIFTDTINWGQQERYWRWGHYKRVNRTGEETTEATCGARLQGSRGNWGAGRGQHDRKNKDGRWRLVGVDACPGGQAIQDRKRRRGIGCIKSGVAQSQGGGFGGA